MLSLGTATRGTAATQVMAGSTGTGGNVPTVGMHRIYVGAEPRRHNARVAGGPYAEKLQLLGWERVSLLLYKGRKRANTPGDPGVCEVSNFDAP